MKTIFLVLSGQISEKEYAKFTRGGRAVRIPEHSPMEFGDRRLWFHGGGVLEEQPAFIKAAFEALKAKDERNNP